MDSRLSRILKNLDLLVMCGFMLVIFVVLFIQVFFRYILGNSLTWSEEIARYSYVWITMLAFGYNVRTRNNISMSLLMDKLPRWVNFAVRALTDVMVIIAFCIPYKAILNFYSLNARMSSSTLGYPMSLMAASIVIGATLLIIQSAIHLWRLITCYRRGEELP